MPKNVMDYSKTIIYKIVCKDINITDLYVGHTTNFIKRKNQHKNTCNNENSKKYNYYIYQFIRNNGRWDNWEMVEIEKYICNDKLEACKRERYWIENLKATLNKVIPSRTKDEYYYDNKEEILVKMKEYKTLNKDKISEYKKQYREINKEKISQMKKIKVHCDVCDCDITKCNLSRHNRTLTHQNNLKL